MMLRRISFPVVRFRSDMDRLFDNVFDGFQADRIFGGCGRRTFPAINVWEEGNNLYAEAEVPGLSMDDLEVFVQGDELSIKGQRKDAATEDQTYHRRERGVGNFSRVLHLPVGIDADKVKAVLRHGVLTITLPKTQAVLPRKIEVKS